MSEQPADPDGLQIHETRLYFDPASGQVLHLHQLVSAADQDLDPDRTEAEMSEVQKELRARFGEIDYLLVDPDDLARIYNSHTVTVDVRRRAIT